MTSQAVPLQDIIITCHHPPSCLLQCHWYYHGLCNAWEHHGEIMTIINTTLLLRGNIFFPFLPMHYPWCIKQMNNIYMTPTNFSFISSFIATRHGIWWLGFCFVSFSCLKKNTSDYYKSLWLATLYWNKFWWKNFLEKTWMLTLKV